MAIKVLQLVDCLDNTKETLGAIKCALDAHAHQYAIRECLLDSHIFDSLDDDAFNQIVVDLDDGKTAKVNEYELCLEYIDVYGDTMKTLKFKNEDEFLSKLDGKVYAISGKDGQFVCDILEDDYFKLCDSSDVINKCETPNDFNIDAFSDYILMSDMDIDMFKDLYGVKIEY